MKESETPPLPENGCDLIEQSTTLINLQFENIKDRPSEPELLHANDKQFLKRNSESFLKPFNNCSHTSLVNEAEIEISQESCCKANNLFRLLVKNGEYVYARPNDIIMMESCDHLVKVYLATGDKIKKTVRNSTLKHMLLQLPQNQFMRVGRFCAVNLYRLSGGNCNEQTFEFDFTVSIKLKHSISQATFGSIGR